MADGFIEIRGRAGLGTAQQGLDLAPLFCLVALVLRRSVAGYLRFDEIEIG